MPVREIRAAWPSLEPASGRSGFRTRMRVPPRRGGSGRGQDFAYAWDQDAILGEIAEARQDFHAFSHRHGRLSGLRQGHGASTFTLEMGRHRNGVLLVECPD